MKHEMKYSPSAVRDLDRVFSEVCKASKSRDISVKYIEDLMDQVEDKASFPKTGIPLYYENGFTGYYYVVFKTYLAFYRLADDSMMVDRVLFRKSDYLRILHLD